jgi:hypothetical protein
MTPGLKHVLRRAFGIDAGRDRRGPSVAVRGKPTVHTGRPGGWTPSAICPWTPRHSGLQRYKMTHDGTEKKRPASTRISS